MDCVLEVNFILYSFSADFGQVTVHNLRERVRNTQSVGAMLAALSTAPRKELTPADVGHDGLPVYTLTCEDSDEAVGEALADIVWNFEKKFGMDRSSLAVVMSFVSNEAQLKESHVPGVIANYYLAYKTRARAPGTKGQESSLVALPLFALNCNTSEHTTEEFKLGTSKFEVLRQKLEQLLPSWVAGTPFSSPEGRKLLWLKSVDWLRLDSNSVTTIEKSPVSEKVRSVLFHLLLESIFEACVQTAEQLTADFHNRCERLLNQVRDGLKPKKRLRRGKKKSDVKTIQQTCPETSKAVSIAEEITENELRALLSRFRYVSFVDSGWIQGCEVNAVVALVYKRYTFFNLAPALSRAKLLAVALMPTKDEAKTRRTWQGPWQDWKEEMKNV
jgi:hypothetical protein